MYVHNMYIHTYPRGACWVSDWIAIDDDVSFKFRGVSRVSRLSALS